jgi:hypothetical protein
MESKIPQTKENIFIIILMPNTPGNKHGSSDLTMSWSSKLWEFEAPGLRDVWVMGFHEPKCQRPEPYPSMYEVAWIRNINNYIILYLIVTNLT